jgi:hypothetical protein
MAEVPQNRNEASWEFFVQLNFSSDVRSCWNGKVCSGGRWRKSNRSLNMLRLDRRVAGEH